MTRGKFFSSLFGVFGLATPVVFSKPEPEIVGWKVTYLSKDKKKHTWITHRANNQTITDFYYEIKPSFGKSIVKITAIYEDN